MSRNGCTHGQQAKEQRKNFTVLNLNLGNQRESKEEPMKSKSQIENMRIDCGCKTNNFSSL